jgi:hypothetical protein
VLNWIKKISWRDVGLIGVLLLFDFAIHALSAGPDRLVHDPAIYRLGDPNYLPGDWYTDMAVKSQVYIFYAKLVNVWHLLHIPEEFWRMLLYLVSLVILYYSLIRIARLFSQNSLVVPTLALFHAFYNTGINQPPWLYGSIMQVDGGLAPRSIGVALSFLALLYLLKDSIIVVSIILGLATLIHVSNSLIVYTLFITAWFIKIVLTTRPTKKEQWFALAKKTGIALGVYLLMGGWFAFYVAFQGGGTEHAFSTEKFIWSWVYFRAPYLALPMGTFTAKLHLSIKLALIIIGWLIMRKMVKKPQAKQMWDMVGLVGLGGLAYFLLFYLFTFIWPWLPGFQFYSIRIVYFVYFVAFLILSLLFITLCEKLLSRVAQRLGIQPKYKPLVMWLGNIALLGLLFLPHFTPAFAKRSIRNIQGSGLLFLDSSVVFRSSATEGSRFKPPSYATFQYLYTHPEPLLAPPNWTNSPYYLPSIVTFKSFGFTEDGLVEWFTRINDITKGELERIYTNQTQNGKLAPVSFDWVTVYSNLSAEDIIALAQKYKFNYFLTYKNKSYPFTLITEDADYRLYRLPNE